MYGQGEPEDLLSSCGLSKRLRDPSACNAGPCRRPVPCSYTVEFMCGKVKGFGVWAQWLTISVGPQVAVGGGLAVGSFFLRALTTPRAGSAAAPSRSRAAPTAAALAQMEADTRRAREEAEEEDLAAAAARDLIRFDRELAERERQRQVEAAFTLKTLHPLF